VSLRRADPLRYPVFSKEYGGLEYSFSKPPSFADAPSPQNIGFVFVVEKSTVSVRTFT